MKRFLALCLLLLLCLIPPRARAAGTVTDTLTVTGRLLRYGNDFRVS